MIEDKELIDMAGNICPTIFNKEYADLLWFGIIGSTEFNIKMLDIQERYVASLQ